MPAISGIELLPLIKSRYPELKVVVMTAYGSKEVVVEALRADADDYLEKPFDIVKVRRLIERLIGSRDISSAALTIEDKVAWAKEFLDRTTDRIVRVKDIADEFGVSSKYLSENFKKRYGCSITRYRIRCRTQAACRLLEDQQLTLVKIAYRLGYGNVETFTKVFKKYVGVTPSVYRQNPSAARRNNEAAQGTGD